MQHKYRQVNTKFWSDVWVVDELNPLDRYLFLYSITNDKANDLLIYEISKRTISHETGLTVDEIDRMFKRLESRLIYFKGFIIFKNGINNKNYNPNQFIGMSKMLMDYPEDVIQKASEFVVLSSDLMKKVKGLKGFERLCKALPNDNEQEQEQENEQEQDNDNEQGDQKEIIIPEKNEIEFIFEKWNEQEIILHRRMTTDIRSAIKRKLKEYDVDEIVTAIETLGTIYRGDDYFWSHKWTLAEFLDRTKGFLVFVHKTPDDYKKNDMNQKKMYVAQ